MPRKTSGARGRGKTVICVFCEGESEQAYTDYTFSSVFEAISFLQSLQKETSTTLLPSTEQGWKVLFSAKNSYRTKNS